jgi:hypothetical protein
MTDRVALAIAGLHRDEGHLAAELTGLSDRHPAEHEIHHVARDLAGWSCEHERLLAELGVARGLDLDPRHEGVAGSPAGVHRKEGDVEEAGDASLALIRDLRGLHRAAAGVSLDWDVLGQTAQAIQDRELLGLAQRCHPQTLRQMKWADAMVKQISAQLLVTG